MILLRKKPLKESGKIKRFRGNKILMKRRKMMLVRKRLLRRKEMIPCREMFQSPASTLRNLKRSILRRKIMRATIPALGPRVSF